MLTRILLAVDAPRLASRWADLLRQIPDVVVQELNEASGRTAWQRLRRQTADLVIVSESLLPTRLAASIAALRSAPDAPEVVALGCDHAAESSARLLAGGCYAVLDGGLPDRVARDALVALIGRRREEQAARTLAARQRIDQPVLEDFESDSVVMREFLALVRRVVSSDATLLVLGETGVGKERLARAIHAAGPRAHGPFVAIHCGAIPESLLESELFGHEEGAFTGATRMRRGLFELAHRGTVFLDEIGEMPIHVQSKLLRVLQDREVQRLGAERTLTVDVRVVAATNSDLEERVREGRFRQDVYFRLSVVTLDIPPLRERREDIAPLARSYLEHFRGRFATSVRGIRPEALQALESYNWPGNVRELVNVVERAMLLCDGEEITLTHLPRAIQECGDPRRRSSRPAPSLLVDLSAGWLDRPLGELRDEVVRELEQRYLAALLRATGGRVGEAARRAGLDPRTLFTKMRALGLHKESFRNDAGAIETETLRPR